MRIYIRFIAKYLCYILVQIKIYSSVKIAILVINFVE